MIPVKCWCGVEGVNAGTGNASDSLDLNQDWDFFWDISSGLTARYLCPVHAALAKTAIAVLKDAIGDFNIRHAHLGPLLG